MTSAAAATTTEDRSRVPEWSVMEKMLKAREHAGIEREAMADALGISVRSIVRYETSGPVPKTAVLLYAVKTAVPADWIDPLRCTPRDLNPEPTVSGRIAAIARRGRDAIVTAIDDAPRFRSPALELLGAVG